MLWTCSHGSSRAPQCKTPRCRKDREDLPTVPTCLRASPCNRDQRNMTTVFSFQAQLVSIMDALSKTAVMEISKLVEIESKMLKIEITRGRNEIASLTEKLQLTEKLLFMAQGGRQDAAACLAGRESSENGVFWSPDRARLAPKCENQLETRSSSSEVSSLNQGEEQTPAEPLHPQKEQTELVVVKEEPLEEENRSTDNRTCEIRVEEAVSDTRRSSDVMEHPRPTAEHQQSLFTDSFLTLSTQQSLTEPGRRESHWNQHATPTHTNLEDGKRVDQNVASQSLNVLRNMKLHNFRNSAAKRFGCVQCGKSFRCFSQLEIHQRSHTGEKPFRCTLCGKRYAQKGHLYTHQRTHTGEKPYRCPICGKGFIQKCTLDMHQRTHTGEKPFVCIKCGKGFTKNCNLKKHLAVHLDPSLNIYSSGSTVPTFSGTFINGTS